MNHAADTQTHAPVARQDRGLLYHVGRKPADRVIVPLVERLASRKILEVGVGTGYYTRMLAKQNDVVGVDLQPQACPVSIRMVAGSATELSTLFPRERFDVVFSAWMTEYLAPESLARFFQEARQVLAVGGQLVTTGIAPAGWGWLYIACARYLRHHQKYAYAPTQAINIACGAGFRKVTVVNLRSYGYIPWAYLMVAQ